jgi:hypothetical protein
MRRKSGADAAAEPFRRVAALASTMIRRRAGAKRREQDVDYG